MKKRNKIFFAFPIIAFILMLAIGFLLFAQVDKFKKIYDKEAKRQIIEETSLLELALKPMLEEDVKLAIDFCNNFNHEFMRITLIDENGKVLADSFEDEEKLDNHSDRQEIKDAIAGKELESVKRFSDTLRKHLLYHANLIELKDKRYVVRTAIEVTKFNEIVTMAENNIIIAICLGVLVVVILTFYIINQIKKPIANLQNSANDIALGNLDSKIKIPEKGVIRSLALSIQEMTHQLQEQLKVTTFEKEEKDKLLNSMSDAIVVIDANCNAHKFNRAAKELFDIPGDDSKFNVARIDIKNLLDHIRESFKLGNNFENEYKYYKYGINYTLLIKGNLIRNGKGQLLLLCATDLTKMRKLESFRSDFISNVSHEIKTPITSIIGAVDILKECKKLEDGEKDNLLKIIGKESKRLNVLIQDILSLSTLEQRQLNPKKDFEYSALDIIMKEAVQSCQKRANDKNIKLEITKTCEINSCLDSQLIEQAIMNLITNAIKYSGSDKITLTLEEINQKAIIKVIDYGIGISAEHQKRIFERFYRVHKERSRNLGGTGLGLAIVKHAVQLHNGNISVASQVNKGCTFTIELPIIN